MIAILNRYRDLPRERAELYEECAKLLLQQWKVEEALRADIVLSRHAEAIGIQEKKAILRLLSREMQNGSDGELGNLIAEKTVESTINRYISSIVKENACAITRALIKQLRERNFILCFTGGESYAFVHRTFLEYYSADDIRYRFDYEKSISAEDLKDQVFGKHWVNETWHEVLCLLSGMIYPRVLAEILEYLVEQKDPDYTFTNLFLAGRCIGEVRKRSDLGEIDEEVCKRIQKITPFDMPYCYNPWDEDGQRVKKVLMQSVSTIASVWRDRPGTKSWLKSRAREDNNWTVRQSAVVELARGWHDDPDIQAFLKKERKNMQSLNIWHFQI